MFPGSMKKLQRTKNLDQKNKFSFSQHFQTAKNKWHNFQSSLRLSPSDDFESDVIVIFLIGSHSLAFLD